MKKLLLLSSTLLLCITQLFAQSVPLGGMIAFYPLTNQNDASGNAYNLLGSGTTNSSDRFGTATFAKNFNGGATTYLYRTANGSNLAVVGNSISISFWYKTTSNIYAGIIDNSNGSDSYGIDNYLGVFRFLGGGNFSGPVYNTDGKWHHIAFTKNGSKGIFYTDGVATDSTNTMTPITAPAINNQNFFVGKRNVASGSPYVGDLDDIAIYQRTLSNAEVKSIHQYNDYASVPVGSIVNYPFSQSNYVDVSGNGKDLTNSVTTATTDRFGVTGNARAFSTNACLYRTPGSSLAITGPKISISFWYKTNSSAYAGFIDNSQSVNGYGIDNYGGSFRFLGGGDFSAPIFNADNQWHHIVFVKNGSKGIFYKDGFPTDSTNTMTDITATTGTQQFNVGRRNTFNNYYNGSMDDIAVFPLALSPTEVNNMYHYNNYQTVVTKLYENENENEISIYPNPASNLLTVDLKKIVKPTTIELIDITGRTLFSKEINYYNEQIDISQFSSGTYFLTISNSTSKITKRIIRE